MGEELSAEHLRLLQQTEALQREHEALERQRPVDIHAHNVHRARLQRQIAELRKHIARLQQTDDLPKD